MTADLVATYYAPGEFPGGVGTVIDEVTALSFLADLRSAGSASVELMNTATTKPAAGGIVAIEVKGTRAFAARCVTLTSTTVADMEANQRTTAPMPGHLSITSKGLIGPPNGEGSLPVVEQVAFNWTHPGYDDSGWPAATVISSSYQVQSTDLSGVATPWGGNNLLAWYADLSPLALWQRAITGNPFIPAGPPDDTPILGPSDGTITAVSDSNAPNQNHYFRQHITVAAPGRYSLHLNADNNAEVYIDQALVMTVNDWKTDQYAFVDLSAGDHVVAVSLQNIPVPGGGNPCGFSWTIWDLNFPGSTLIAHSDSSAVALEYQADPPGMTVSQAIRLALAPHVAAGEPWATAITLAFDDVNDSASNPLPIEPNLTAQCKDTVLDLISKVQQSYADVWMDPNGWTLHLYDFNTFAPASGLTLSSPGNITTLTHTTEEALATRLLIRSTALGWTSVGSGDTEAYVELGTEIAAGDVGRIGNQILAIYGAERLEITATYQPVDASEIPWVHANLVPGALATAPAPDGSPTEERVLTLGCSISQNAPDLAVQITLKDRIQELNERIVTELTQ